LLSQQFPQASFLITQDASIEVEQADRCIVFSQTWFQPFEQGLSLFL